MKRLLLAFGLLLALGGGYLGWQRWQLARPSPIDRGQSAIWMAHRWVGKPVTHLSKGGTASPPLELPPATPLSKGGTASPPLELPPATEDIDKTASQLARLGFRDLYFHVGPLDAKGDIPVWDRQAWTRTLAEFRAKIPGLHAYAWVGGVTVEGYGVAPDTLDMTHADVRAGMVRTCQSMVTEAGFDGIHYDIEPLSHNPEFLTLLDETRQAIQPHPLSVAGSTIYWNGAYMAEVCKHCDQLALMCYELNPADGEVYQTFLSELVPRLAEACRGSHCRLVFGLPCYAETSPLHNPKIESLRNGLLGVKRGILKTADRSQIQGMALYAHWTADDDDWKAVEEIWRP